MLGHDQVFLLRVVVESAFAIRLSVLRFAGLNDAFQAKLVFGEVQQVQRFLSRSDRLLDILGQQEVVLISRHSHATLSCDLIILALNYFA